MIKASILADSRNEFGNRLTTMLVTFPRIILAEMNTHRMFSRNSASSRAIPFEKMIEMVKTNPFIPIAWQANHKGMQGTEYLSQRDEDVCLSAWLQARNKAVDQALHLAERGLTKQIVNRLLEPFMYHTAIISATEWENFFALRCPQYEYIGEGDNIYLRSKKDYIEHNNHVDSMQILNSEAIDWKRLNKGQAEIHMMALAEAMWDAMNESTTKDLKAGEWHIPDEDMINSTYHLTQNDLCEDGLPMSVKVGTMLAARTSYTTLDTKLSEWSLNKLLQSCDDLIAAKPMHASPTEHCAIATTNKSEISGNFTGGWRQFRKLIPNENITK